MLSRAEKELIDDWRRKVGFYIGVDRNPQGVNKLIICHGDHDECYDINDVVLTNEFILEAMADFKSKD